MRKAIALFVFLFASVAFAQVETQLVIASDTLGNSQTRTGVVHVPSFASEVVFIIHAKGEADIDQMIVTEGWTDGANVAWAAAQAGDTTTVTINLAAGAFGSQASSTRTDFEGANIFKVAVTGASSGNDGSDPNAVKVYAQFYK